MKVAILSFNHIDPLLPLAHYLGKHKNLEIDLYLIFSQKYKTAGVLSFEDVRVENGLLSEEFTKEMLGKKITTYLKERAKCRLFVFNSAAIYDLKNLILAHRLALHLKKQKYNIIHFNGTSGFLLYLHFFLRRVPRVNTVHDPIPHSGEESWFLKFLFSIIFRLKIQYILHSTFLAETFIKKYQVDPKRVQAIYYGAYEVYKFFAGGAEQGLRNMILFFGRISPYKGIEHLIEAAKIIRKSIPDLKVIIAGKGRYVFDISAISRDQTFQIINRYIPKEELTSLIQKSSLIVCPYTDATQSGVVMTAYAFNKPVVASRVGGLPEVIENDVTGKLVPPKDPEALAVAISDLLMNPDKLEMMKGNIQRRSESGDISWKQIAEQTIAVYKKAVAEQS